MAPIIPSTTATITVGNVGTTLGNATKNMDGFRGFGGSVPSSGAISMSQCQKIQYGVGYYNSWFIPTTSVNQGTYDSTGITNQAYITYSVWLASSEVYSNWRNLYHVTDGGTDGSRKPASWIVSGDTGFHVRQDTSGAVNDGIGQTTTRIAMNGTVYNLTVVLNGTNMRAYVNGSLSDSFTLAGTPYTPSSTSIVYSPDPFYSTVGDYALNYLWFFPYPMTSTQVSTYYNSLSSSVSLATGGTMSFSGGKVIHVFTSGGTFTTTRSLTCQILVVGGGGGAGWDAAGGGGGGQVVYNPSFTVSGSVSVTVGNGGGYATNNGTQAGNGGSSVFSSITAIGGGGGGSKLTNGASGASGGGAGHGNGTAYYGGNGTAGYNGGNNGSSIGSGDSGGGGGGAGGAGSTGTTSGGAGGSGVAYSITGTSAYYGGGGGGGYYNGPGGAGGAGGGGRGGDNVSQASATGQNGTPNTGGGGGSNGNLGVAAGGLPGSGGSGVVIIAYTP